MTEAEPGGAPAGPLVLIHGLGASRSAWRPILAGLRSHHRVFALDLPGHGEQPRLRGLRPPSVGALTDAIESRLDLIDTGPVHLVGNSLGGRVAIELAARGRARTLVALSPSGMETPVERAGVFMGNQALRARSRLAAPFKHQLAARPLTRALAVGGLHARPRGMEPVDAEEDISAFAGTRAFQATLLWAGMLDVPRRMRRIRCRTRIVFGSADVLGVLTAPRYAAAIPGAELVALPGCGHMPMADAPELVARSILEVTAQAQAQAAATGRHT